MIRAVFFDFYGTLAGWQPPGSEIQHQAAAEEGVALDQNAVERAYPTANTLMDRENAIQPLATRGRAKRDAFFARYEQTLLSAAGCEVPLDVAARIWERVRDAPKRLGLYADAIPALEALKGAGLPLGVISNMGPELERLLADLGLGGYVDVAMSSGEAGVSKPHARIFQAALAKVGVRPTEALHVGDGYESDVVGARNAGVHPLLLLRDESQRAPVACAAVRSLADILPYLVAEHDFR